MKRIKIIRGAYGHKPTGTRIVVTKTSTSDPFDVSDEEAARLVKLGIAEVVGKVAEVEQSKPPKKPPSSKKTTAKKPTAKKDPAPIGEVNTGEPNLGANAPE